MGLFSQDQMDQINAVAAKSKEVLKPIKVSKSITTSQHEIEESTKAVLEYFGDSPAILITSVEELHDYVSRAIEFGYCGIDTETTGLDRIHDTIVGFSLYFEGVFECYIPCKHIVPIFETPYKNQLDYAECGRELQRFVDAGTKMIFANADFDLAMIYKDFGVDLVPVCYYDVILAWRCLKENEPKNGLKQLYSKYVMGGKTDPKKFSDFFNPKLFPYCKPEVAKLYAANDAKITFELFKWQLPYVTKSHPKCQKNHLEKIADLVWNIEFPMIRVCALMHRVGVYFDMEIRNTLKSRYDIKYQEENAKLADMIQEIILDADAVTLTKSPFKSGKDFNEGSPKHVVFLLKNLLHCDVASGDKATLTLLNLPVTNQILKVRALGKLLNSFIDKLPEEVGSDGRVHSTFKSIGADTGRMCIAKGTKITCLNGTKNIEDIVPGDYVYCYDDDGTLQLRPVKNLWLTGKDRECVKIKWQSTGSGDIGELICTPEHRILLKSGEWTRADQLKRYDKLAHLRRTIPTTGEGRPRLFGWNNIDIQEQAVVKYSILHADLNMIIHHKDGDKTNNSLDNLEIMAPADHASYHAKELQRLGVISVQSLHTEQAIQNRIIAQNVNFTTRCIEQRDELLEAIKQANGRLTNIPGDFDSFKRRCLLANIDVYAECAKYNSRYAVYAISEDVFLESYRKHNGNKSQIAKDLGVSYQTCRTLCTKYGYPLNHMVQSVTPAGTFDVYDIEVEDIHNFIANEICVHNSSSDPNVQQIPSHALDIRHQFRATPAMEKVDDCKEVGNTLQITLGSYDSVTVTDNNQHCQDKDIIDLCVGDYVISRQGALQVVNIVNNLPYSTIIFDNPEHKSSVGIRHITPPYVMMSSDYSQQEPKILAYKSGDPKMIDAFQHNRDIYSTIASLSFNRPYEDCLEFYVDENGKKTDQVNREGKERRTQSKSIVLGITYGRSTKTVGDQLFGKNKEMTDDDKTKAAQAIYDAVLNAFPNLRSFMIKCQSDARTYGYVETILGRRRHIPDMQLKPYEFKAGAKYVNPDIDPLDPKTLKNKNEIPERIVKKLEQEFANYKYKGQIYKRIKELEEVEHIKVINNTKKITDATRKCVNSVIQGSAAELTKIAMLKIFNNKEWHELGARVLLPVHDEIIAEVPIRNAKRAGELLGQLMSEAGNFLPFTISCDVATTYKWYGLDYPCAYDMPTTIDKDSMTESEIKWVQYHLFECEYQLPIYNDKDGKKPIGDASLGINGMWSQELDDAITDYLNRYHISKDDFINHIEEKVNYNLQKLK